MLVPGHTIYEPPTGGFLIDDKYVLEVGGNTKTYFVNFASEYHYVL